MTLPASSNFAPVVRYTGTPKVFDFTCGYDPEQILACPCGIGRYNEKRKDMYISTIYNNCRDVHMGIDFWMAAGSDVFSFSDGTILYFRDNDNYRDYGPTIVTEHQLMDGKPLYALYGHLTRASLENLQEGQPIKKGEKIGEIGEEAVNGGWAPHLHFQLSIIKPKGADMPGVVSEDDLQEALRIYPDPQLVLGKLY